jgi:ketosteroid isomerase-like protein
MESDERAVREALKDWSEAVNAGNLPRLLTLITDDVVFLNHMGICRNGTAA